MPAVMSAVFSAIYATMAREADYKDSLVTIFPAMENVTEAINGTMTSEEYVIGVREIHIR